MRLVSGTFIWQTRSARILVEHPDGRRVTVKMRWMTQDAHPPVNWPERALYEAKEHFEAHP